MNYHVNRPKVALVYPPFGPSFVASLGLALLSAGIKRRGFECRTFYWAYRFRSQLPGDKDQQQRIYDLFTQRLLMPWNEWIFTRHALGERLGARDAEVRELLPALDVSMGRRMAPFVPSELIPSLNARVGDMIDEMAADLEPYDIIGISSTFYQTGAAIALSSAIKQRWPHKLTVLGGANADGEMGSALLDNFEFIDCVFTGEVDHELPEFVQRVHTGEGFDTVRGLKYRAPDGSTVATVPAPPLQDLDSLPTPDFDDWLEECRRYGINEGGGVCLPLESSRGCWWGAKHHCTFCGLNANGMGYRQKRPERFQAEVEEVVRRYNARFLFMTDNILSTQYYDTFLDWARRKKLDLEIFYEIKSNLKREQVRKLVDAGVHRVQPGIEHFSTNVLRLMNKGVTGIQNIAFLKYAREVGLDAMYNLLFGFPGEKPDDYRTLTQETLPKLVHLQPPAGAFPIDFDRFSPYHKEPQKFGIQLRPHKKYEFVFPVDDKQLARLAYQFQRAEAQPRMDYADGLRRAVAKWQRQFDSKVCSLTWSRQGSDVLIEDRRPGFPARNYRLRAAAVPVFLQFETPRSVAAVVKHLETCSDDPPPSGESPKARSPAVREQDLSFTREEFAAGPEKCLREWVRAGLLLMEDNLCVNLAVTHGCGPIAERWSDVVR